MRTPNLFLVGVPKAWSSLLWTILKEHKDIFFSTNLEKENNHLSYDELIQNSYYKDYKGKSEHDYLKVLKHESQKINKKLSIRIIKAYNITLLRLDG